MRHLYSLYLLTYKDERRFILLQVQVTLVRRIHANMEAYVLLLTAHSSVDVLDDGMGPDAKVNV